MAINDQAFTAPVACYNVPQRYGAISQSTVLGTTMLMNCTGIVMRAQTGYATALAHVEAGGGLPVYQKRFNDTLIFLIDEIRKHTGYSGALDVAITGNMTGQIIVDQLQTAQLATMKDLRSGQWGQVGTMTINPVTGDLCCAPMTQHYYPMSDLKRKLAFGVRDLVLP